MNEAERPRLLVVAGPNGAGKTTIIQRWSRSMANAGAIAAVVDRLYLYDNSIDGREPLLVLRASKGRVTRRYAEPPEWAVPIVERLS